MALRTSLAPQPHLYMGDMQGRPLDAGKVYFGEPNKDPELYPINVYYDEALTIAAPQPIRTMGGFMNANGQMTEVYAAEIIYSVKVLDGYGRQVFYQESMSSSTTGSSVSTRLPYPDAITRTLQEKSSDTISVMDFGGTGNGITNDTSAFSRLESNITGRSIDLQGKTYKVDSLPYANDYINGVFDINNTKVNARGNSRLFGKTSVSPINIHRDGQLNYSPRHTLKRAAGSGSGSVVQSFAIDHVNRYMYTLTATSPPFICRYKMDGAVATTAIDKSDYSSILGHQGLTVEYLDSTGNTKLWTSHPAGTGAGGKAVAFKYKAAPDLLNDYETWTLLQTTTSESVTPSISADGRYLLVRFQSAQADIRVRVFDMEEIKACRAKSQFDVSELYLAEFSIPKIDLGGGESVQDIACDGNYIYVLWATFSRDTGDLLVVLDMAGNIIRYHDIHQVGLAESVATTSSDNQHEPEALEFARTASGALSLMLGVSYGETGTRPFTMYELGGNTPVHSTTKNKPAFLGESATSLDYAVAEGNDMRFGAYSSETGDREFGRFDKLGRFLKGITLSLRIDGNTNGFQWHSTDTQANAVFGRWSSGSAQYPQIMLFKSSSNTIGTSVANAANVQLGALSFYSDVGAGTSTNVGKEVASIKAVTTGAVVAGTSPTRLEFLTTSSSGNYTVRWVLDSNGDLLPTLNNGYSFGSASNVVKNIYLQNSPIVSSDERLKQDFRKLKAAEKRAAIEIKESIYLYKMRDSVVEKGDGARWHVGVKAQEIVAIMEAHKLKPFDYGFICHDEWEAQDAVLDEDGSEVQAAREAGDKYAVRYDELAMFIIAAT